MRLAYHGFIYEAVNINKDYLLKIANGDIQKLKIAKDEAEAIIKATNTPIGDNDKHKVASLLTKFILQGALPANATQFLHDILVENKLNLIYKLNSDSSKQDFENLIDEFTRKRMSTGDQLSGAESCIWLRVKTFHDFEDGFKWIIAVDERGEPVGYIPSAVTFKTMKHCGNEPSVAEGDTYYGLRDANNREYVTVILDGEGSIKESKGYNNTPPKDKTKINKYMQWLMLHPIVKGTSYENGYARHMNYGVSQMIDDEDFIKKVENEKPELINSDVDKIILDWKRKIKNGESTEGDLIGAFLHEDLGESFMFEHLIGILGHNPFNEQQMVSLINMKKLEPIQIANAGTQYLTIPVQHASVDIGKYWPLVEVFANVPHNKIDFQYIIDYTIKKDQKSKETTGYSTDAFTDIFRKLPTDKRLEAIEKYSIPKNEFKKLFLTQYDRVDRVEQTDAHGYSSYVKGDDYSQALVVKAIIEKGGLTVEDINYDHRGGLLASKVAIYPNILKVLLNNGVDPNANISEDGSRLFTRVVDSLGSGTHSTELRSVKDLVDAGAEITYEDVYRAFANYQLDALDYMLSRVDGNNMLNNEKIRQQNPPLLMLVGRNLANFTPDTIKTTLDLLFKHGANPNIRIPTMDRGNINCVDAAIHMKGLQPVITSSDADTVKTFLVEVLKNGFTLTDKLFEQYRDVILKFTPWAANVRNEVDSLLEDWIDWENS